MPLVALAVLVLNDHLFKAVGILPSWLIGKLSDFAGVVFFPLLLTAVCDTLAFFANRLAERVGLRPPLDDRLRRWKLLVACGITAAIMAALQLSAPAVELYLGLTGTLGFPSMVDMDPTDLIALVLLPVPYLVGMRRIAARERRG